MQTPDRRRGDFCPPNVPISTASHSALVNKDRTAPTGKSLSRREPGHQRSSFHIGLGEIAHHQPDAPPGTSPPENTARSGSAELNSLNEVQEEAARRVAQRLHDDAGQMLATVYLELARIKRDCPAETATKIDGVVRLLDQVREQIRDLSHELRPPILDRLGLIPALQYLADGYNKHSGLELVVPEQPVDIPPAIQVVLYRVVQEALSNVVRHAEASKAEVRLWVAPGRVHCVVRDNGTGFNMPEQGPSSAPGLGLLGIYERVTALGGDCQIVSCRRRGTQFMELQVEIPL